MARRRTCIPNNEDNDKSTWRIRPRMCAEYPMHNIVSLSAATSFRAPPGALRHDFGRALPELCVLDGYNTWFESSYPESRQLVSSKTHLKPLETHHIATPLLHLTSTLKSDLRIVEKQDKQ
ncbi:hypothetical protein M0804_009330 [Polistes exclamans]|nr:hypothetical protein M0804_009330 [Polistes exclamans]